MDASSHGADGVQQGGFNGDGRLDVITCKERDPLGVVWYENLR